MKKIVLLLLVLTTLISSQTILPISIDIMREVQMDFRNGEIEEYISLVTNGKELTEEDYEDIVGDVEMFFESSTFIETGGAYLSALFTERELNEVLTVLRDSSLKDDPNYGGAKKLDIMMRKLKPYIVKYLRRRAR